MSELLPQGRNIFDILRQMKVATSQSGRLVMEYEGSPEAIALVRDQGRNMDLIPSQLTDSRINVNVNITPWREMRRNWPELINTFDWLRIQYMTSVGRVGKLPTLHDQTGIALTGVAIPSFLFNRADDPIGIQGQLPENFAQLSKGLQGIADELCGYINYAPEEAPNNAGEFYQQVNELDHLVKRRSNRGCPVPKEYLEEVMDVALFRHTSELGIDNIGFNLRIDFAKLIKFAWQYSNANTIKTYFDDQLNTFRSGVRAGDPSSIMQTAEAEIEYLRLMSVVQATSNPFLGRDPNTARQVSTTDIYSNA